MPAPSKASTRRSGSSASAPASATSTRRASPASTTCWPCCAAASPTTSPRCRAKCASACAPASPTRWSIRFVSSEISPVSGGPGQAEECYTLSYILSRRGPVELLLQTLALHLARRATRSRRRCRPGPLCRGVAAETSPGGTSTRPWRSQCPGLHRPVAGGGLTLDVAAGPGQADRSVATEADLGDRPRRPQAALPDDRKTNRPRAACAWPGC
jgi:hypothetical protein